MSVDATQARIVAHFGMGGGCSGGVQAKDRTAVN